MEMDSFSHKHFPGAPMLLHQMLGGGGDTNKTHSSSLGAESLVEKSALEEGGNDCDGPSDGQGRKQLHIRDAGLPGGHPS